MIRYKVIVRRGEQIVHEGLHWASTFRENAVDALTREMKKMYGEDCTVEIH